ncbi:MAG: hypothetical protein HY015_08895 [Bacteroidetes bacterium]|nr:hypothetical protein [Bacteroidota bacterium]MBI3483072.1 hypothetical protein [Bacteroidota bacterium]
MVVKITKKESSKKREDKIRKASAKSKKIDWDKYFGKIDFPVNAITYQQKMRDEWQ